jgi:hypothetical protein
VGLSLGAVLARWAKGPPGARGALPLLAFGALVLGPACAYPLLFFPDWAFAYLFDARSLPSAVVLALLLADALAPAAGHLLARRALAREALGEDAPAHAAALALAIVPAGLAALVGVALAPRLATVGNFAMVRGDFGTEPLWRSPLGYALVWMTACIAAGAWLTARAQLVTMGLQAAPDPGALRVLRGATAAPPVAAGAGAGEPRQSVQPAGAASAARPGGGPSASSADAARSRYLGTRKG